MKKNISINISGIIFHIEEDGYEKLKEYLESINKYFSTFDGSTEIIADIESRIAEIFLSKLNDGKQVITEEDVTALMATMGGIQDFQAVEEDSNFEADKEQETTVAGEPSAKGSKTEEKKLYRDKKRKLIGGVAAGIGHYFAIDPLWIRLIFIVLLFDVFITFALGGLVIISYIILWIILPEADDLVEDKKLKKMYRDPQDRVIGGVATGVAAYFDIDVTLVRVLFVLSILMGGSGLIAYIVLWIILPEAKSITDKVQMKGEPVTLENIESNIKSTQEAKEHPKEESTLVKVLLFPFRLIATILSGLAKALGPIAGFLIDFIRIVVGIVLTIVGLSILFAILISGSVFLGLMAGSDVVQISAFPVELINETLSPISFIAAMIVIGIPALAIMFLGLSIVSKTRIPSATVGWAMFAIWLVGIIGISFTLPALIYNFKAEGEYSVEQYYDIGEHQLVLDINNIGYEEIRSVNVKLRGYEGDQIKLVQEFSARGASRKEAVDNARAIDYDVIQQDSVLIFDSNIDYANETRLRGQELSMTLYIPYGQAFSMLNNFDDLVYYSFGYQGYSSSQIIGNTWMFNPSGLECLTCDSYTSSTSYRREKYEELYNTNISKDNYDSVYSFSEFEQISISGPFKLNLVRGDEYRVVLNGYDRYLEKSSVSQSGDELIIRYEDSDNLDLHRNRKRVTLKIMCPSLTNIKISGAVTGDISGFEGDELTIKVNGASTINLDTDVYTLYARVAGASQLNLTGSGELLNANISSASQLNAYNYLVKEAEVRASDASKAKVYASDVLNIEASLISDVRYRGGAKVTRVKSSSFSKVKED